MKFDLKLIIIVLLLVVIITLAIVYNYSDIKNKFTNSNYNDIIMFIDPSSKDCIKMLEILGNENSLSKISIIDVSSKEGIDIVTKNSINISKLPLYVNIKLGTTSNGLMKTTVELRKSLEK